MAAGKKTKRPSATTIAMAKLKAQQRANRGFKKQAFYTNLLEEHLRKPATLENMWELEKTLQQRTKLEPQEEMFAHIARMNYVGIILVGKRATRFTMEADVRHKSITTFVEEHIQKISHKRKVPRKQAAKILVQYATKLEKRLSKKYNELVQRETWGLKMSAENIAKAIDVRHELLSIPAQDFRSILERVIKKAKKYQ